MSGGAGVSPAISRLRIDVGNSNGWINLRLISIPNKRLSIIFGVLLLLILPLLLVFYLLVGNAQATESYWKVAQGKEKVSKSQVMPWFGPSPYLYTIPNNNNAVIFAPHTRFYIEPWTPKGKKKGHYVWQLNLHTLSAQSLLYQQFISLTPQLYSKPIKIWEKLSDLPRSYDLTKENLSEQILIEAISFNNQNQKYKIELSVSNFKRLSRNFLGLDFINNPLSKRKQTLSYSGVIHLKFFELSKTAQLKVELTKHFNNWSYPLRGDPKKYTIPSIIAVLGKLYLLPDSRPCFMLVSPAYKGRIYTERPKVEDKTFRLIIL